MGSTSLLPAWLRALLLSRNREPSPANVGPSTSSTTRKCLPSNCSMPYSAATLACFKEARTFASRSNAIASHQLAGGYSRTELLTSCARQYGFFGRMKTVKRSGLSRTADGAGQESSETIRTGSAKKIRCFPVRKIAARKTALAP
jgi:hypothetical protein